MSDMKNKVAIVTGASRGIGAAIAERLGHDGFTIIVNYAGNAALADAVVNKIEASGGIARAAQADVADPAAVKRMFDAAEDAFGGVDVLVNNAGIMTLSPLATTEDVDFDKLVSVNLKGTFNTMREAGKRLRDNGRIINFSTTVVGLKLEKLRCLCCNQGRSRNADGDHGQGNARSKHQRQCRCARPHRDRPLSRWKIRRTGQTHGQDEPARTSGDAGRHCRGGRLPAGPDGAWVNGQTLRANGGII